uniref:Uncharacterized protein n=1 Tax=Timema genevievae TaxID=629358 RepID=A0A7R9JSF5_TIMGE|nr:unnamed protein product [Timema genevievae]
MNTDDKVFMSLDDIIKQNKSPKSKGPGSVYSVKSTASRRSRRRRDGQRGRGNAGGRGGYQVIGGWNRRGPVVQQRGRGFQLRSSDDHTVKGVGLAMDSKAASLRYRSQMPNLRFGVNSSLGNRFRQRYGIDQRALFPSSYKSVVYNRNLNQQYVQNRVRNAAQFLRERQSQNRQFYQQNYRVSPDYYGAARFSPADVDNMTVSVLNDLAFRPRGQAGNRRRRGKGDGGVCVIYPPLLPGFVQWGKQGLPIGACKRDRQCPSREPIESGVLFDAEYSGEIVMAGSENMACGAVQAVERVGGAACASTEERDKGPTEQ